MTADFSQTSRSMSQKILGVGIIATGALILAIALIIGLKFPSFVYRRNLEDMCVLSLKHDRFSTWANNKYRDQYTYIYYWQLTNADDFIYHNAVPKVVEQGPYVYKQVEKKIDVKFRSGLHDVSFVLWVRQEFDEEKTKEKCGRHCTENDNITIINPAYFHRLSSASSDLMYALQMTPSTLDDALNHLNQLIAHEDGLSETMRLMGFLDDNRIDQYASDLHFPSDFQHFSFADYLANANTPHANTVIDARQRSDFSAKEMYGLYEALVNPDIFGAMSELDDMCRLSLPRDFNFTYHLIVPSFVSSTVYPTSGGNYCGLLNTLQRFNPSHASARNFTDAIAQYLCVNSTLACFELPTSDAVRDSMVLVLRDYVLEHLPKYVFYQSVILSGESVVASRPQRDFALGYSAGQSAISAGRRTPSFVPGILEHAESYVQAKERCARILLSNCYDATEATTNFKWKAYQNLTHSTSEQFPDASLEQRQIAGYWLNLPPVVRLKACKSYELTEDSYEFFLHDFWRTMSFVRGGHERLGGVSLRHLVFNETNMLIDGAFVEESGLQSMRGTYGFLSWLSLPHFLLADNQIQDSFGMMPDFSKHLPYIDVEPMTGAVWRMLIAHQLNIGIQRNYIRTFHYPALNTNYTDVPIPVYWLKKQTTMNGAGIGDYKKRVGSVMMTSCGGLAGLSFVAASVIIMGVVAATVTIRGAKVAPLEPVESSFDH